MSYLNSWHRDYAAESLKSVELLSGEKADQKWTEFAVECGQVAKLALNLDDDKAASIAKTVVETICQSAKLGARSYRKITPKQRYALAQALIKEHGTARAIAALVWGLTDDEIDNADV